MKQNGEYEESCVQSRKHPGSTGMENSGANSKGWSVVQRDMDRGINLDVLCIDHEQQTTSFHNLA